MSNYWLNQLEMWVSDCKCVIAHDCDDLMKIVQKMKQVTGNAGEKMCRTDWHKMDDSETITYTDASGVICIRTVELILKLYERGYFYRKDSK